MKDHQTVLIGMLLTGSDDMVAAQTMRKAADEIERLQAENTRMRRWIGDAMSGHVTEAMKRRAAGDRLADEPSAPHVATFGTGPVQAGSFLMVTIVAEGKVLSVTDPNGNWLYRAGPLVSPHNSWCVCEDCLTKRGLAEKSGENGCPGCLAGRPIKGNGVHYDPVTGELRESCVAQSYVRTTGEHHG